MIRKHNNQFFKNKQINTVLKRNINFFRIVHVGETGALGFYILKESKVPKEVYSSR